MFKQPTITDLAAIALFVLLLLDRCNGCKKPAGTTQVVKRDTVTTVQYIQQPQQVVPQYQPIIVESKAPQIIPQQYVPSTDNTLLLKQYMDLINKFIAVNSYKDSVKLKDSTGADVGTVKLNDVVSENQIKTRDFSYQLKLPVITKTITVTQQAKPVNQIYFGGGIIGNQSVLVNGFEVGAMLKNRRDQLYGVKAMIGTDRVISYGLQSYWKIKLHK